MVNNTLLSILIIEIQSQVYRTYISKNCYIGNYLHGMSNSKLIFNFAQ